MSPEVVSLIITLVQLVIKYEPELQQLVQEVVLLVTRGDAITADDLEKIQAITDQINKKLSDAADARIAQG